MWKRRGEGAKRDAYRWVSYAVVIGLALGAPATVARARPSEHVTLTLEAPESCPSARALLANLDAQLGNDFETDTHLRADANVRELGPSEFELRLRYETNSGARDERRLRGESCDAVSEAAVLLLAIVLNPRSMLLETTPTTAEPSAPAPTPAEPLAAPGEALLAPHIGALAIFDTAVLPRVTAGVGLQMGLRIGPLWLRARGQLLLPRTVDRSTTAARFAAWSFDLGVCTPFRVGPVRVGPCARAEVGRLSASVQGEVREQSPGAARFQALGLGAEARARLAAPLWLTLSADFTWIARRPQFVVTDLGQVGQPARFGLRVCMGPLLAW